MFFSKKQENKNEEASSVKEKEEEHNANQLWKGLEQFKKVKKERSKK